MHKFRILVISFSLIGLNLSITPSPAYANDYDDAFVRAVTSGSREELEKSYDLDGNTSLDDARIVLFSEDHGSQVIIQSNFRLLEKLVRPGDVILFETKVAQIDVSATAAMKMGHWLAIISPTDPAAPFAGVNGTGWDFHEPSSARLFCNVHHDRDRFVLDRNVPFKKVFDKLKCRRIFVIAGAMHFPSTYTVKKGGFERSVQEMQKVLAPYPHAILTMKDFNGFASNSHAQRNRLILGTAVGAVLFKALPAKIALPVMMALYAGFQAFMVYAEARSTLEDLETHCLSRGLNSEGPAYADVYESQRAAEDAATGHLDAYCPKEA